MFLCMIVLILLAVSNAQGLEQISCSAYIKCSFFEDPIWATDGKSCFVFRNACLLQIENCDREFNNELVLKQIRRKKCQKLCEEVCAEINEPVCATYNEEQIDFVNRCLMELHSCKTGEDGPCNV